MNDKDLNISKRYPRKTINLRWEIGLTWIGMLVMLIATVFLIHDLANTMSEEVDRSHFLKLLEDIVFSVIVLFLIYGNVVYQLCRLGYLKRLIGHKPATREELEHIYDGVAPPLAILVPSYKEDARVVRQTLMSAALQEYPNRRVVLLIDDPPYPSEPEDLRTLSVARRLPEEVSAVLEKPASRLRTELTAFMERDEKNDLDLLEETRRMMQHYLDVSAWFAEQVSGWDIIDHTDRLFVKITFQKPAERYRLHARDLARLTEEGDSLSQRELLRQYRQLSSIFAVEIASFERKRYVNLSHESNKAMNLNSYIGLLGKGFRSIVRDENDYLEAVDHFHADFTVPHADYLITLDADSILTPDYALRLVHIMEKPGNERFAVVQTPYSAIPDPHGTLERIAGATTDIQYIIHQGFTSFSATFWVGANALLRKSALECIVEEEEERGYMVARYIQDRTVIEDTESSVDLINCGWQLYNYPERLAYSATPADFGALLIQRRRWANGGLIILPKLLRYLFNGPDRLRKTCENFFRFHYLTSVAGVNFGLVLLLLFPFNDAMNDIWLPLTALPYYVLYGRDLLLTGYKVRDLFRVYALNLMLVPVNLGGVCKSLQQGWTKKKIPFCRTPKVSGRTATPALYILAEYLFFLYCFVESVVDGFCGRIPHACFAIINAAFLGYAVVYLMGLRECNEDLIREWSSKGLDSVFAFNLPGWSRIVKGLTALLVKSELIDISSEYRMQVQEIIVRFKDNTISYIPCYELDDLLDADRIDAFQRSNKWVSPHKDPIRGQGLPNKYNGPERRMGKTLYA